VGGTHGGRRGPDRSEPIIRRCLIALVVAVALLGGLAAAHGAHDVRAAQSASLPVAISGPDIPPDLLPVYQAAAQTCPGLDWAILTAIGKVESDHGRSNAPGVHSGTNSAGAMGPMQFLAPTWDRFQTAAPGHVIANVYNPADAIYTAAKYLCNLGAATSNIIRLRQAIFGYNHSWAYVDSVLGWADTYRRDPQVAYSSIQPAAQVSVGSIDFARLAYSTIGSTLYSFDGYLVDLLDRLWGPLVVGEDNLGGGKQIGGVLEVDNSKLQLVWQISLGIATGSLLVLIVTLVVVTWMTQQMVSQRRDAVRGLRLVFGVVILMAASFFLVSQLIAVDNGLVRAFSGNVSLELRSLPAWQGIGLQNPDTLTTAHDLLMALLEGLLMLVVVVELAVLIILYFIRLVLIWVLVAVAPFALAASILPGGKAVAIHWAKLTLTTVFLKFVNTLVFLTFVFMAAAAGTGVYNELLVLGMLLFMIMVPRFLMRAMAEPAGLANAVRTTWLRTSA
jgi:Transglycosylase SLT domain